MKLAYIREALYQHHADALVVINHEHSGQPDTAYIAGFTGSESILVVTKDAQILCIDGRYTTRVKMESPDYEVRMVVRGRAYHGLVALFKELGVDSLLLDPHIAKYSSVLTMNEIDPSIRIISAPGLLQGLRQIKSGPEIQKLQKAADIACKAFDQLVKEIQVGKTEKWVAARLEYLMKDMGADKYSFDTIVASGTNGAFPHYSPSTKELVSGELITIDWGCFLDGYASDMTRTVALGQISDRLRDIYETVKGSQQAGLDKASARVTGSGLDMVCRNYIDSKGYGQYFVHGTGHGLGMDVHEQPNVNSNNDELLPVNSVVSIEPGIYIEGVGGVRIEDCVVIKEDGCINLNDGVTKELMVL
jgi:Xaa-Pro aminopeptidase